MLGNTTMKKSDIAEKVREIQQRQQNWLKQHQAEKKSKIGESAKTSSENKSGVQSSSLKRKDSENSSSTKTRIPTRKDTAPKLTTQPQKQINLNANKRRNSSSKFENWLQSRSTELKKENCESKTYKTEFANNRDDAKKRVTSNVELASVDTLLDVNSRTQMIKRGQHSQLISPEQFNDLAEKIVSKVKNDLCITETGWTGEGGKLEDKFNCVYPDTVDHSDRTLSSHHCGVCSKHMITAEHMPMLLIPCGHNVCKKCSHGKSSCPVCHCAVSSSACNIMLQQIIHEYQGRVRNIRSRKQSNQSTYSPHKYLETKGVNYQDKLQTLLTRLEVLREEKENEISSYTTVKADLSKQQHQLENISRQEDSIHRQISSLEEKLTVLKQHKSEYEAQCSRMKQDKEEARKRVTMLDDTIASLCAEIDKMRLLSEGSRM